MAMRAARREERRGGPKEEDSWVAQPGSQVLFLGCPIFEVLYEGTRGPGKSLPVDEPVLTPTGFRRIGDLSVGDEVLGPTGEVRRVVGVFPQGELDVFRVRFRDGAQARASGDHLWQVHVSTVKPKNHPTRVLTTEQVAAERHGVAVPLPEPLPQPEARLPVDPYLLGLYLGDGCAHDGQAVSVSSWDPEIQAALLGHGLTPCESDPHVFYARGEAGARLRSELRGMDLMRRAEDKHVPEPYLWASLDQRWSLLQGLMDTDGSADARDGHLEFSSASLRLAEAVVHLTRSLGGTASLSTNEARLYGVRKQDRHRVHVGLPNARSAFRLPRKQALALERRRNHAAMRRWVQSVEPDGRAECVCIRIDGPDGLFVTRDFVVTHNTDTLLMDYAQDVGRGHGPAWRGVLFRQTHPQLADVIAKSKRWFPLIFGEDGCEFSESKSTWSFADGEQLLLRQMRVPDDYWNYHGHEYPWIAFEELTNWADDVCYKRMMSCSRSSRVGMPRKYRSTCNPYGRGHNWVKARWQLPHMRGRVIRTPGEPDRVAIHGHIDENLVLLRADPEYISKIRGAARNPSELAAWLDGSWDIVAGGMFDDLWQPSIHLVQRFRVPRGWRVDRSLDWGTTKPFSVGWWAQSDGSDLLLPAREARHGLPALAERRVRTCAGDLFRVGEWYGCTEKPNEGLKMTPARVAEGIRAREVRMGLGGRVMPGPADTMIFSAEPGVPSVAREMEDVAGVRWMRADKGPDSRVAGWDAVRQRLEHAADPGRSRPGMFVVEEECPAFLRTFPTLPRDDSNLDDVDTDAEDHIGDEVRYRVRWRGGSGVGRGTF